MSTVFLLEDSLVSDGTHHFDLVDCLASGARSLDFEVRVGANQRFVPPTAWDSVASVDAIFPHTVYQPYSSLAGVRAMQRVEPLASTEPGPHLSWWSRWHRWYRAHRRSRQVQQHIAAFSASCRRLFQRHALLSGDHVIIPTATDLELLGGFDYLMANPDALVARWSFIFHFGVFAGRPENYAAQMRALGELRERIQAALERLPEHRLRFFATTAALAEQYQRLGLPGVEVFHYPAAAEFFSNEAADKTTLGNRTELRFVVAGAVRREKGQRQLLEHLQSPTDVSPRSSANIRWVFQTPRRRRWQSAKLKIPDGADVNAFETVPHPLPKDEYVALIKGADVGVLMYDRERYFARCAGVLGEFFAAKKPVIVSAGCWLGDQLDATTQDHAHRLLSECSIVDEVTPPEMTWLPRNVPQGGGVWNYDGAGHPFEATFSRRPNTGGIIVEFDWHLPRIAGCHCLWELLGDGTPIGLPRVVAYSAGRQRYYVFLRCSGNAARLTVRLSNPYGRLTQSVNSVKVYQLGEEAMTQPIGAVGIAVANDADVHCAAREICEHLEHYRRTARTFAVGWQQRCSPLVAATHLLQPPPTSSSALQTKSVS